jgi:hypothetical protein
MNNNFLKAFGLVLVMSCLGASAMAETPFTKQLEDYGKKVAATGKPGVFKYVNTKQTMSTPLVSYVVKFRTADVNFRSRPGAATNKDAYLDNTGRRLVWEAKFCTQQLRDMMREARVNIVNGDLTDDAGETQFVATCMPN